MTAVDMRKLAGRYRELLQSYLKDGSETALSRGYELGRSALVEGRGALELAAIHHEALRHIAREQPDAGQWLKPAEAFFAECLSPFEMSHRGAQEGTRALRHLNELSESEVQRIAHALHDEAGQLLASVYILLADMAAELPPGARSRLDDVQRLLRDVEVQLRDFSHELRPTVLDNLGLVPALEFLAERVTRRTGLAVSVSADVRRRLPAAVETALYRIVQEALNNTVKHAHARSAVIELQLESARVSCSVQDDGCGFAVPTNGANPGLGLIGIRERLNALGGALRIVTRPQQGSTLFADIPLGN